MTKNVFISHSSKDSTIAQEICRLFEKRGIKCWIASRDATLGKSYGEEIINASQFSNPEDIIGALHQVRDEVLNGKLPFVFWDEFDSKEYLWLQYLLAPMQDGIDSRPITGGTIIRRGMMTKSSITALFHLKNCLLRIWTRIRMQLKEFRMYWGKQDCLLKKVDSEAFLGHSNFIHFSPC